MKIIINEKQLKFLLEQERSYTYQPPDSTLKGSDNFLFDQESRNCYDLLKFMDAKITEMLGDGKSKDQIAQMFASNVKLDSLPEERQNQLDPYNILRSDLVKTLKTKQGNLPVQRLLNNCTSKYELHKDVIKNKSVFKDLKIKIIEMPRGSSELSDAQCGRPNWGRASRSCMKPLFTGPQYK